MARVFLSYDRDDTERARPVALALEKAGHLVWWDLHIRGGEQFSKKIDEALQAADAVVVLWSKYAIESPWVRDEAAAGRDSGRLIPVSLDDAKPPLGFRQYQTVNLSRWRGRGKPAELQSLLDDVEAMAPSANVPPITAQPTTTPIVTFSRRSIRWRRMAPIFGLATLIVGTLVGWKLLMPASDTPSVVIEASSQSAASRELANDLFVKLGSLQASNAGAIRILDAGAARHPTMIFEVGGDAGAAQPHANLVLLNGDDHSLFWSKEFSAPGGAGADLKQQLGLTAARIIGCATEGLNKEGKRIEQNTLKLYLNACAAFAETAGDDPEGIVAAFREVTKRVPDFESAWANLLLAESAAYDANGSEQTLSQLKQDVAAVRQRNPNLIELLAVEIDLLSYNAFGQRLALADRAVELGPDKALGYAARSGILLGIGRMNDAVEDARKAVQLDPLWPVVRDLYIQALLYAGRLDAAKQELAVAERLWPGATNIKGDHFRINLRYGDPAAALKVLHSGTRASSWIGSESYLEARIDRSPAKIEMAIQDSLRMYQRRPDAIGHIAQVFGEFGRENDLLELLLKAPERDVMGAMDVMFRPTLVDFWYDPRSLLIAKRIGLLQFWMSSGKWPDFCTRNDLPYDCKKEAARLLA